MLDFFTLISTYQTQSNGRLRVGSESIKETVNIPCLYEEVMEFTHHLVSLVSGEAVISGL